MKLVKHLLLAGGVLAIWLIAPFAWAGATLTTSVSCSTPNGTHPSAGLIVGNDGNFYGTTEYGGGSGGTGLGTVFKMTPAGALTTLVSFNNTNGANPVGGLVQGNDGNFYGTTEQGGAYNYGTVFKMTPAGALTTLVSFNNANGANPVAGLVQGGDGNFYGTTSAVNSSDGFGTVFKMTPNGALTTLVSFNNANGAFPTAGLVQGTDGNFYGTTSGGGPYVGVDANGLGYGTIFKIAADGTFTSLYAFTGDSDGFYPLGGLTQGNDGNFYGTTAEADAFNDPAFGAGTVYRMTPGGALTTLASFNTTNGANPYYGSLLQGADGNFYGTTEQGGSNGYGTIFQVTPAGALNPLLSFNYFSNGANPTAGLAHLADGTFYGTTYTGGSHGYGTIFKLFVQMPPVFQNVKQTGNSLTFSWSAIPGQSYQVLFKTNWAQEIWTPLGDPIIATNGTASASDTMGPDPSRFYRIQTMQ